METRRRVAVACRENITELTVLHVIGVQEILEGVRGALSCGGTHEPSRNFSDIELSRSSAQLGPKWQRDVRDVHRRNEHSPERTNQRLNKACVPQTRMDIEHHLVYRPKV
jgi:hypothetical protein